MRISVIVPCHNAAPWLAQTLGSVLDQSQPPHEILIVDDASTDASLDIARRFARVHPDRVRMYPAHIGHASRVRNLGALAATGEALMFLDADDVLGPNALASLAGALDRTAAGVAIGPWFRLIENGGRWERRPASCEPRRPGQDALAAWLTGWYHPPCSVLWSRDGFERAGRWDEQAALNQDGDLMMRALVFGVPLAEASGGESFYRRHEAPSVSGRRNSREGLAARIRAVEKIAFLLLVQGRRARYAAPLAQALRRIETDAGDAHPDLAGRARRLAEEVAPSRLERARGRWRRARLMQPVAAPAVRTMAPVEIRYGLDRARAVLQASDGVDEPLPSPALTRPAVSVVVPAFNRSTLLRRAIDSVLAQTFGDFELIVVDDASTDDTEASVRAYRDPRVRYLRQPQNAGVSAARNRGIRESRGDYVAFLDCDDEWLPGKLAAQVARLQASPPEVGLIYTGVESVAADGTRRVKCSRARGDVYREMLAQNVVHGGGSNVLLRRDAVAAAGFFDEALPAIEDYEYWVRVTRFFRVDVVEEPLIRYDDPEVTGRRSQAWRANRDARESFYRRYGAEMRRAGVAHLFFLKGVRRALAAADPDWRSAGAWAARALLHGRGSRATMSALRATLAPHLPLRGSRA